MSSGYFGESNLGNERSSSSGSSSSRKGKKGNNSDKPKQPQRGLGVAQLEKIRLHSQMGCSAYLPSVQSNPYSPNFTQEDVRLQTAAYSSAAATSSFSYSTPSSSSYGFPTHQNLPMGMSDFEGRANIRYVDSHPPTTTRWPPGNTMLDYSQQFAQPSMTRQLLDLQVEDSYEMRKKGRSDSIGSSTSHNSESNCNEDLDLELRLSL
ncbi:hypothetical protein ACH5RR_004177 [Cinchona calisaya]|uniref:Uncharacterized protein n=1 Tax=Cinchona calisaya TaxID=153742 RepID=A0ABD3AXA2_9GENT